MAEFSCVIRLLQRFLLIGLRRGFQLPKKIQIVSALNIPTSCESRLLRALLSAITLVFTTSTVIAQDEAKPAVPELQTVKDKVSYGIGMNIARQFKSQGLELNVKSLALGIAAIMEGTEPALTQEEIQAAFAAFEAERAAEAAKLGETNLTAARKFLTENATKEGVKKTKSGLQYVVLKEGTGATPTKESRVSTHYRGKLLSGKTFDESYKGDSPTKEEEPVSFGVTQVISGWTEALQLMKVGAKYRLFIPPDLAYGENGPGSIGPNSLLIFDIELVGVE